MCTQIAPEAHRACGLDRPALAALTTRQAKFGIRHGNAMAYNEDVAPFAAVDDTAPMASSDLVRLVRSRESGVVLLQADDVAIPDGVRCNGNADGVQMVLTKPLESMAQNEISQLTLEDMPDMRTLVALTEPGPFCARTICLGNYFGVRHNGRLIAMAGERMRLPGFTEISAVCVHPEHRGRGLARQLVAHVGRGILDRRETPFLHTFADNETAISLYHSIGFRLRRKMRITSLKACPEWQVLKEPDAAAIEAHFNALAEDAFRQRFGCARSPHFTSRYVAHFFQCGVVALGHYQDNRLVAIGEIRPSAVDGKDVCEVGLTVSSAARGQRLGLNLATALHRKAREYGFRQAEVFVEHNNKPMLAILRHFRRNATRYGGTFRYLIDL